MTPRANGLRSRFLMAGTPPAELRRGVCLYGAGNRQSRHLKASAGRRGCQLAQWARSHPIRMICKILDRQCRKWRYS